MFFYKLLNFFYTDRILGQAGRKIGESVGSISRGPTPAPNGRHPFLQQASGKIFKDDVNAFSFTSNIGFIS
jgi:hypothetical protein